MNKLLYAYCLIISILSGVSLAKVVNVQRENALLKQELEMEKERVKIWINDCRRKEQ